MENITVRPSHRIYGRIFKINLECEPDRWHQAVRQCRVWRSTARIRGDEVIGGNARWPPIQPTQPQNASSVAVSWPMGRGRLTQSWLHRLVIRPTTTLRWNPGNVAIRVLDVAGFAMDAILGVDLVTRPGRLLDPFIDAGGAIAV